MNGSHIAENIKEANENVVNKFSLIKIKFMVFQLII